MFCNGALSAHHLALHLRVSLAHLPCDHAHRWLSQLPLCCCIVRPARSTTWSHTSACYLVLHWTTRKCPSPDHTDCPRVASFILRPHQGAASNDDGANEHSRVHGTASFSPSPEYFFIAPRPGMGREPHIDYDCISTWSAQIRGRKRWRLWGPEGGVLGKESGLSSAREVRASRVCLLARLLAPVELLVVGQSVRAWLQ